MENNYINKWLIFTLVFVFAVYIFGTYTFDEDLWIFVPIILIPTLIIIISLIVVLIFYFKEKSKDITISYIFLACAMVFYVIAEILWVYFESINIDPYPSLADLFYVGYFVSSILFCSKIIWKYFKFISIWTKIGGGIVGVCAILLYLIFSVDHFDSEMFQLGTFFTVLSSILLSVGVIVSFTMLKSTRLRDVWLIFGIMFCIDSVADVFYYASENTSSYLYTNWVNIAWFGGGLVVILWIIYSQVLYKPTTLRKARLNKKKIYYLRDNEVSKTEAESIDHMKRQKFSDKEIKNMQEKLVKWKINHSWKCKCGKVNEDLCFNCVCCDRRKYPLPT